MDNSILTKVIISLLVIIYTFLIMEFVDGILKEPKLTRPKRLIVGFVNAGLLWIALGIRTSQITLMYIVILFVLFIEILIFYKDTVKRTYFMATALVFHIMALHSIVVAVSAWTKRISNLEVITSKTYEADVLIILMLLLVVALLTVIKVIPTDKVKVVCEHKEQLFFMNIWLTVFDFYLMLNARVYTKSLFDGTILENQIIMPLVLMMGLYIVLYFSFCMSKLLGYQSENEILMQDYYKEQQYREAFIKEAIISYETNFTRATLTKGFEKYEEQFGDKIHDYNFMQREIIRTLVYKHDIHTVYEHTDPKKILELFKQGISEITFDYRRLNSKGGYGWVRSVTHVYKDRDTEDIMGFTYLKDIDKEKQQQLALKERAERDSLTGLYNKGTTEMLIVQYLDADIERKNVGALFVIDVDNFKNINDHLGHAKGDEVLRELTNKLKRIFRSDDIVGRVGGDEFLVYLKRPSTNDIVEEKAKEICHEFDRSYTSAFGVTYAVSASIGVAQYPEHGDDFGKLYRKADIALYNSKNRGKNAYSLYDGESFAGYESSRTKIDEDKEKTKKHFIDNRIGYVFETLYYAETIEKGINDVLELLTKHYNYSRGYIFETSEDGTTTSNTFEWCNRGITPEIDTLKGVPIEAVETSTRSFLKHGNFIMKSLDSLPELDRSVLEPQGIKSMLQFGIFESKQLKGFIGFDDCVAERHPDEQEIEELGTVCNIISIFLVKHRVEERIKMICEK